MKLIGKRHYVWVIVPGAVLVGTIVLLSRFPATNVAETQPDHPDPLLRTRHYAHSMQHVRRTVQTTIGTMRTYGRKWMPGGPQNGLMQISLRGEPVERVESASVPVLIFWDDLTVILRGNNKETMVNVRSASRVGKGDFGENRRHIIQLLEALDRKLKR